MFYIGIDIAKNTHWASIMSSDGEIICEPFSFPNNNSGFQIFISKLESLDKEKILIGLESTAHYGENIISYLFKLDYKIGLINPIQTALDQIFPELVQFFKGNPHLNVSYQLLKEYSSPKQISSLHLTKLSNILHDNSRGKYGKQDAIRLREIAKSSVGINNPSLSLQIKHAILQIELYNEQIAEVEALYKEILDEIKSPILTIPGMSYNQAAVIIGCIGDINRFTHSCQLLAYAGLDPSVIQSGNFQAKSTRMSKRGSGMLRYSLVYSAHNVVLNNKTFKEYYDLKRSQGKSHYCALGHVAHKLVRIIFKILKDNVAFNLD